MAGKEIWFGTKGNMAWVPAPLANHPTNQVAWREVDNFLNGGSGVRRSAAFHKELDWSWGVQSAEALAHVVATLQQPGPYYFVEPIAARTNAVPAYWATPTDGGPPLIPGVVPNGNTYTTIMPTPTNLEIPVPEGHTLHLGVHGTGKGFWSWVDDGDYNNDDVIQTNVEEDDGQLYFVEA